ncbi:MAG: DUF434 domain-containing protein [Phaeodactylibacter sp.]|nr:DUF434 domain-containing protein [Phaeodactylibacter sp.]
MPDSRKHRGQHPSDARLFGKSQVPKLQQAVRDLSWLLSRGYSEKSSLKLVGDRYRLQSRQRLAVSRSSCSRQAAARRRLHALPEEAMKGNTLYIDGFNVLITIESALSGGFILEGADGCYRDMASIHGSYKRVVETEDAILLAGKALEQLETRKAVWYLDRPVSNSGRLKQMILEIAGKYSWDWESALYYNPDNILSGQTEPTASSDSVILDGAAQWFNLARYVVTQYVPGALVLPLGQLARAPSL